MDKETKEILTEGENIAQLIQHPGWAIVRQKLCDKILELQMVGDLEGKTPELLVLELKANKKSANTLFDWLTNDIEGIAKQHINNNIPVEKRSSYIVRD